MTMPIAAHGYRRALKPFDFDQQPDTNIQRVFCLSTERNGGDPMFASSNGQHQTEYHLVTLYLARKGQRNEFGVVRQMKIDMATIMAAVIADSETSGEYMVDDSSIESEVQDQPGSRDFIVGRLRFVANFDRELAL